MRHEHRQVVRSLRLFEHVDDETFDWIAALGFLQTFPEGTVLHDQGRDTDFFFVVVDGQVEMTIAHNGIEATVAIFSSGHAFPLGAVILGDRTPGMARAASLARVLMIPAAAMRDSIGKSPVLMRALMEDLAQQNRTFVREIANQKIRTGSERLASWILLHAGDAGAVNRLPFRKRTLASLLGMTAENLSRAFATVEKHGVFFRGSTYTVTDRDALQALAKPSELIDAA
jgi:CRP/FNR family transcriptional activator FtrB